VNAEQIALIPQRLPSLGAANETPVSRP